MIDPFFIPLNDVFWLVYKIMVKYNYEVTMIDDPKFKT